MKTRTLSSSLGLGLLATVAWLSVNAGAEPVPATQRAPLRLATGQYVTPTTPRAALQQFLNPGLPSYPDFVAGEAVRSQLSPDGKTLAVLCAGQNSLDKPDGTTDTESSTQYIFLYDVSGSNRASPQLRQVLEQTNAHVGLVFAPDGKTLYVTGGVDDVVYAYTAKDGRWSTKQIIPLGHADVGLGVDVRPNASGLSI